jgi:hypothetical protein
MEPVLGLMVLVTSLAAMVRVIFAYRKVIDPIMGQHYVTLGKMANV